MSHCPPFPHKNNMGSYIYITVFFGSYYIVVFSVTNNYLILCDFIDFHRIVRRSRKLNTRIDSLQHLAQKVYSMCLINY